VTKACTQIKSIDYEEIFAPVVLFASICLHLFLVIHLDLELFQMDVKAAFLSGNLKKEIYMN